MIPYGKQAIDQSDINAVIRVLKSDYLTTGPNVAAFEQALCRATGAKFAVAVCNGTAALHLAYLAAGLKRGDEVIVTPNTFVATTNMLLAVGAKPVFCDIRLDTNNIDEKKIESLITKKTKAIVAVHFAGQPCAMDHIWRLAKKYKLRVIEDAAHALGASYHGKPIGSGKSDFVTFSFHPVKSITTGEGGAVLTNNPKANQKMRILRSQGVTKDAKGFNVMTELGYNYRLTDIQAALGISQLKKLKKFVNARRKLANYYLQKLKSVDEIILPATQAESQNSWHLLVIQTKNPAHRLPLYRHLLSCGIGVNFHYPCVYSHPYYRRHGYAKTRCPNADRYASGAITLPLYPTLPQRDINHIIDSIKNYFE